MFFCPHQWKNAQLGNVNRNESRDNHLVQVLIFLCSEEKRHNVKDISLWIAARDGLLSCTVSMQLSSLQCAPEQRQQGQTKCDFCFLCGSRGGSKGEGLS